MNILKFDLSGEGKSFKILNATNGGPWHKRHVVDQVRSNFEDYKAARFQYTRNHDSAFGNRFAHDINYIFPNFDADPYDPASYDFDCTDEQIGVALDADTKTFFRLGQSIEHEIRKHFTIPPKDFKKWAVICEHIIRHYTEGWANGFEYDMPYWEIWNEPDLDADDSPNKRTWGGTMLQFFDLYEITAKHLKTCFPHLKIGGPALAWNEQWGEEFLREMQKRNVPIDFFSWHIYCTEPKWMVEKAERIQALMEKYGYGDAENHLNEWNYVKGWTDEFQYTINAVHSIKGAAFTLACICEAQQAPIDMLMYYDTRPSAFNGAFDYYSYEKLKGYYPLYWYGRFYDYEKEIPAEQKPDGIYTLCGVDKEGKATAIVCHYSDDDDAAPKSVAVDFGRPGKYEIYLLDKNHDAELVATTEELTFEMQVQSAILIKEI